jgi:hypothetical protein
MRAFSRYKKTIAGMEILSFLFLLQISSLPLPADAALKKAEVVAGTGQPAPRFLEQAGTPGPAAKGKSRILPTLIGLALTAAVVAVLVLVVFKAKGYDPHIDPVDFVPAVDNPYLSLPPGQTRHYLVRTAAGDADMIVEFTLNKKIVMGILCLGVHERVIAAERLFEDTWRWYAQDRNGDVWYFASENKKYDYATVTADWSWAAGIDGAKPGVAMFAQPQKHLQKEYWLAYAKGLVEEKAQVLGIGETVTVVAGTFTNCVKIEVYSDLAPGVAENRYYAPGFGLVLSETAPGGDKRVELVSISSNQQ